MRADNKKRARNDFGNSIPARRQVGAVYTHITVGTFVYRLHIIIQRARKHTHTTHYKYIYKRTKNVYTNWREMMTAVMLFIGSVLRKNRTVREAYPSSTKFNRQWPAVHIIIIIT